MRNLHELQTQMQHFLLQQSSSIHDEIVSTAKASANTRLTIYADAYYLRLLEVLQEDYVALAQLMGAEEFAQLIQHYIYSHPSTFRSIRWYGHTLPNFLRTTLPYTAQPWLAELAAFEWALAEAFDERDCQVISVETMSQIPFDKWPEMGFVMHPSLRSLRFEWNTIALWKAITQEQSSISPVQTPEPTSLIVWRKEYTSQYYSLAVDEAYVINAMHAGKNFTEICEGLCAWVTEENAALHMAQLLKRFIVDQLIAHITF